MTTETQPGNGMLCRLTRGGGIGAATGRDRRQLCRSTARGD